MHSKVDIDIQLLKDKHIDPEYQHGSFSIGLVRSIISKISKSHCKRQVSHLEKQLVKISPVITVYNGRWFRFRDNPWVKVHM